MDAQHFIQVQIYLMFSIHSILFLAGVGTCSYIRPFSSKESNGSIICCLPCSQEYLLKSLSEKHNSLLNSDFPGLLAQEFCSFKSCKGPIRKPSSMLRLSALRRHLIGEGSHRHLVSSMKFDFHSDAITALSAYLCRVVVIERLPSGTFADPFELQHLVQRGVFHDASVYGDTNLELPSALSNQSVVEVHMDVSRKLLSGSDEGLEISIELPLHARYPPLDGSGNGYSRVEMGVPHLLMRCEPEKSQHEDCLWTSIAEDRESTSDEVVVWPIPCGNAAHAGIVSTVTFLSALISAVSILFTAIYHYSHQTQFYQRANK
ncbi:uncharacterized protein LOC131239748 [Magnolia sinica]|uniref:uncharacterized protein LOC131239748 n=1 Tax=Magnolia sinica TaxID=86752 RepID=UPI002657FB48|nr:uncharacterized protein LOC131239748 [Magnolia sinica]